MKLRKGEKYITREGQVAEVLSIEPNKKHQYVANVMINGVMALQYTRNGKPINGVKDGKSQNDLVYTEEEFKSSLEKEGYIYMNINENNNTVKIYYVSSGKQYGLNNKKEL